MRNIQYTHVLPGYDEEGVGGAEQPVLVGEAHPSEGRAEQVSRVRVGLQPQLQVAPAVAQGKEACRKKRSGVSRMESCSMMCTVRTWPCRR